jgi:hypothetical protein
MVREAGRVDWSWDAAADASIALFSVIMSAGFNLLLALTCRP